MLKPNILLCTAIISSLLAYSIAFFLQPSIYQPKPTNKLVCQYFETDQANSAKSYSDKVPYLECAYDGTLRITDAKLVTSKPKTCPLQYTYENKVQHCKSNKFINQDVTEVFKELCENKNECSFTWKSFPPLICSDYHENWHVDKNNQALNVTYTCRTNRPPFRPFVNHRYSQKFSRNFGNPFRKLSYNRLMMLDGPAIQPPMPLPIPIPMPIEIPIPQPPPPPPMQFSQPPPPMQYNQPPPMQYSQPSPPTPMQYSQPPPPPMQYSQPPPQMQYSQPPPMQYSQPPPMQYSQPPPMQYSQPPPPPPMQYSQPPPQPSSYNQQSQQLVPFDQPPPQQAPHIQPPPPSVVAYHQPERYEPDEAHFIGPMPGPAYTSKAYSSYMIDEAPPLNKH